MKNSRKTMLEITLECFKYIGHYKILVKGNVKEAKILEVAFDNIECLENRDIISSDCKLKIIEDEEAFECFLLKGEYSLKLSGPIKKLQDYIVKVEIVEHTKENEDDMTEEEEI